MTDISEAKAPGKAPAAGAGLEGIVAGKSSICTVGRVGDDLRYRGYSVSELAEKNIPWEELAYVLIYDRRPSAAELDAWRAGIVAGRQVSEEMRSVLKRIPAEADPMDVLRTGWSFLGNEFPEGRHTPDDIYPRLLGSGPSIIARWYNVSTGNLGPLDRPQAYRESDQGGYFLAALRGEDAWPTDDERRLINISFLLYTEHGFNASTFAARVAASTLSDIYSAIVAAVGTLKGPLHGGANEEAMKLIASFPDPDAAEAGILDRLARKDKIMGFGHRVYRIRDPRSDIMKELVRPLSTAAPHDRLFVVAERIEHVMKREKNLFPNADFYSALAYNVLGIPIPLYTPIFAFARVAGWLAHIAEQRRDNRLIRPTEEYTGPDHRSW